MRMTLILDDDTAAALKQRAEILDRSLEEAASDVFRVWFEFTAPIDRFTDSSSVNTHSETGIDPLKYNRLNAELMVEDYLAKESRSR